MTLIDNLFLKNYILCVEKIWKNIDEVENATLITHQSSPMDGSFEINVIIKVLCLTEQRSGSLLERKATLFSFTSLTFLDVKSNVDVNSES